MSARRGGGPTDHEAELELLGERAVVVAGDDLQQPLEAAAAALVERLGDRGEADVRGHLEVVEAHQRQVAGHLEPLGASRFEHSERLRVGRGEDRRRRLGQGDELARQPVRDAAAVRPEALQLVAEREPRRRERLAIALQPLLACHEAEAPIGGVADERDPLVPELDQVLCREAAAADVVDDDAGQARMVRVDQHDRGPGGQEGLGLVVGGRQRDDQHAVGAVERRHAAEVLVALGGIGDVADDKIERRLVDGGEHPAYALDGGRVREERDHHPERVRRARRQRPGAGARPVAEVAHRGEHALSGRRADLTVVEDARDGAHADARTLRDICDRRPARSGPVLGPPHPLHNLQRCSSPISVGM